MRNNIPNAVAPYNLKTLGPPNLTIEVASLLGYKGYTGTLKPHNLITLKPKT